jgi:hypothetical protein
MSTVSPPERRSAAGIASGSPPAIARPDARAAVETSAPPATPLFTRHMLGAIEAERDGRRALLQKGRVPRGPAMVHPRLAAALAAHAGRRAQARVDLSRWVDEGGRFDPEGAARLRIADREMKRCNS